MQNMFNIIITIIIIIIIIITIGGVVVVVVVVVVVRVLIFMHDIYNYLKLTKLLGFIIIIIIINASAHVRMHAYKSTYAPARAHQLTCSSGLASKL